MSVSAAAKHFGEHDTRLWRVLGHYVSQAHEGADWSQVRRIMVDETSRRKGHDYVTAIVDAESRDLLLIVEGRESLRLLPRSWFATAEGPSKSSSSAWI